MTLRQSESMQLVARAEFPFSSNRVRIVTTRSQVFQREKELARVFSRRKPIRCLLQRGGKVRMLPRFTCTMCNRSRRRSTQLLRFFACLAIIICTSLVARGQTASLHGQVFDESGAVVPNAAVTLTGK